MFFLDSPEKGEVCNRTIKALRVPPVSENRRRLQKKIQYSFLTSKGPFDHEP